ncbi:MAG: DUF4276 family protein [Chitinispirillaceae bacterium]|nr:DUF4276 family protein [Chitinispirillaceae bacterium]
MEKILLLVEGQTEEKFVKELLNSYLNNFGKNAIPTIITTKPNPVGKDFKGGSVDYSELKKQIKKLLNDSSALLVSTIIDYYAMSNPFNDGTKIKGNTPIAKVKYLEDEIRKDINHPKFLPYFSLHEFEAILFSKPEVIVEILGINDTPSKNKKLKEIQKICKDFSNNPEEIDDNPKTCPSARIKKIFPSYQKSHHSILICKNIGIDQIKKCCTHFSDWLDRLTGVRKE